MRQTFDNGANRIMRGRWKRYLVEQEADDK